MDDSTTPGQLAGVVAKARDYVPQMRFVVVVVRRFST